MKSLPVFLTMVSIMWSTMSHGQAGALDPSFGEGDGLVTTSFFTNQSCFGYSIATQADGKIVVAGTNENANQFSSVIVARYSNDGTLDPTFNSTGKLVVPLQNKSGYLRSMVVQPDQKIVLLLAFKTDNESGIRLYRIMPDGNPDTTFNHTGWAGASFSSSYASGQAMALQPDGKIVVCGNFGFDNDPDNKSYVLRFTQDGSPDSSFGITGLYSSKIGQSASELNGIVVQPDGKILCAGYAVQNDQEDFMALRLTSDGHLDFSFSEDAIAIVSLSDQVDRAYALALQPDGKVILAGEAYNFFTSAPSMAVVRLNDIGVPDTDFHEDGMNIYTVSGYADRANSLVLQPDGKLLLGGYVHANVNDGADMAIMRLWPSGIPDDSWSDDGVAVYADDLETSSSLNHITLQPDGLIAGTGFVLQDNIYSIRVARMVSGLVTSNTEIKEVHPIHSLSCSPSPFTDQLQVTYTLNEPTTVTLILRSIDGKIYEILSPASFRSAGTYTEQVLVSDSMAKGLYLLTIETPVGNQCMMVLKIEE